ncbi:hypothetical protein ACYZTX_09715 [Pseudomonas sp. MDT1-17]
MNSFCFRAECIHDALNFMAVVAERARVAVFNLNQDAIFPDCDAEMVTTLSLKELILIASNIHDAHVIQESIKLKR